MARNPNASSTKLDRAAQADRQRPVLAPPPGLSAGQPLVVRAAPDLEVPSSRLAAARARQYRRAETLLSDWLEGRKRASGPGHDVLDRAVRTPVGLKQLRAARSAQARRWGVVTALTVEDFRTALEQAHERD